MPPRCWRQPRKAEFTAPPRRPRPPARPLLERLESRLAPAAMTYNGGPLLGNVQVEAVYYNPWNDPTNTLLQAQRGQLDAYFQSITGGSYLDLLSEYSAGGTAIGRGSFLGDDFNNTPAGGSFTANGQTYPTVDDSAIRAMLSSELAAKKLTPGADTLYFVFPPPGAVVTLGGQDSTQDLYGYHSGFTDPGTNAEVYYAVVPYPGGPNLTYYPLTLPQLLTEVASHELAEAITDPQPGTAWFDPDLGASGEVGDLCDFDYVTENNFVVQEEFSNAASGAAVAAGTDFFINSFQSPTEGLFSGVVATFTDAGLAGSPTFTAYINWGDGSGTQQAGTVQSLGGNTYVLLGTHAYTADEGTPVNLSVWITDGSGRQAHATGQIVLQDYAGVQYAFNDRGLVALQDAPLAPIPVTAAAAEGQALTNQLVAQFSDPGTDGTAADYTATITWDDGGGASHTSAGRVTPAGGDTFSVYGDNTLPYAGEGTRAVTVAVQDVGGSAVTVNSAVTVADPPVSATGGFTFLAAEGAASAAQTVATFTDPGGAEPVANYGATIDWGDGTTSSGTITFAGTPGSTTGPFIVSGSHTYTEESGAEHPSSNPYPIKVTVQHGSAPAVTVATTAVVADPQITVAAGPPFNAVEGALSAVQTVATFTDPAGYESNADYTATINWGDGSTSAGAISNGAVTGSHKYREESSPDHTGGTGAYTVTVTVRHEANPPIAVQTTAVVTDPQITVAAGPTFKAVEGTPSAAQTVATFTDPAGYESNADYTATINWGDGSTSAGAINNGAVTGSHKYREESSPDHTGGTGAYTVTVTMRHEANAPVTVQTTAVVTDPQITVKAGPPFKAVEGALSAAQTVATFTDPAGYETNADYTATIAWGDGSTSAGTVSNGVVTGSHKYREESSPGHTGGAGAYAIKVTVRHEANTPVTVQTTAVVSDPAVLARAVAVSAVEGKPFTSAVATFTDPGGAEPLSDYSATIAWGDGTTAAGRITFAGGVFTVAGSHTYPEEGSFPVTVTVRHEAAPAVTASSRARVADAPLTVLAQPGLPLAFQNMTTGPVVVATFRDANPGAPVGDFRQTSINWGDGTVSAGTVQLVARAGTTATFRVVGSHTYGRGGTFHPIVLIPDVGGQRAAAVDTVNVATDVSGQVAAGSTPQGPGTLAYIILVHNTSSKDLRGPFQVAFTGLNPRIQLAGASLGSTALSVGKTAGGTPYATIPAGVLTRGGSFKLKVWFSDPLGLPVAYRLKIFAALP